MSDCLSSSVLERAGFMYSIKGFNPHTFIDWEGKVACVIYLPGCNFKCPFCHSSGLVVNPQELTSVPLEHIERFIKEKQGWVDAVVIGGGEPTLTAELPLLLQEFKSLNILIKLDTNGTNPKMLEELIARDLVDYVAMDIKAPLEKDKYEFVVKSPVRIEDIRKSIGVLMETGIDYEFRTTVVPELLREQDILQISRIISGANLYVLQQFSPKDTLDPALAELKPYSQEKLKKFAQICGEYVKKCIVRGI